MIPGHELPQHSSSRLGGTSFISACGMGMQACVRSNTAWADPNRKNRSELMISGSPFPDCAGSCLREMRFDSPALRERGKSWKVVLNRAAAGRETRGQMHTEGRCGAD